MRIDLIRHGRTSGNLEKRYIGCTDEPLCREGIAELRDISYPPCGILFVSPMRRCIQTAKLLYPRVTPVVCIELRECDFGDFEGRNYKELSNDIRYQKWIDSGGNDPFPGGESPRKFRRRCVEGFLKCVSGVPEESAATFVVHGGTIMAVMERFALPHMSYFDWQTDNGHGYITEFDGKNIIVTEKI